ncbi:MAG: hypothetical protein PVI90_15020 [Desulfobacteraceae bacterium]|jgi:hypothetical protein
MQPIYLPFSTISGQVAEHIYDLLGTFTIYHPGGVSIPASLSNLIANDIIQLYNPIKIADDDILAPLIRDYYTWANLQGDNSNIDIKAFWAASDSIPYFDNDSTAHIHMEINQLRKGKSPKVKQDPVMKARLFLALAQEHDVRKMDLVNDLCAVAFMEKALLNQLAQDSEEEVNLSQVKPILIEDVGGYMPKQRLDAWSIFYRADQNPIDIFVTDSRSVIEQFCETSDDLILISTFNDLEFKQDYVGDSTEPVQNIKAYLRQLAQSAEPMKLDWKMSPKKASKDKIQNKSVCWYVYMVPGVAPDKFWQRYGDSIAEEKNGLEKSSKILNTLILQLEL